MAQLGRALRSGRRGRWFESSRFDIEAARACPCFFCVENTTFRHRDLCWTERRRAFGMVSDPVDRSQARFCRAVRGSARTRSLVRIQSLRHENSTGLPVLFLCRKHYIPAPRPLLDRTQTRVRDGERSSGSLTGAFCRAVRGSARTGPLVRILLIQVHHQRLDHFKRIFVFG